MLRKLEDSNGDTWRTHHAATVRKVRNRLSNLSTRCAGLVTDDGAVSDLPFGSFVDRAVYVVDVANVEEDAQDAIVTQLLLHTSNLLHKPPTLWLVSMGHAWHTLLASRCMFSPQ